MAVETNEAMLADLQARETRQNRGWERAGERLRREGLEQEKR